MAASGALRSKPFRPSRLTRSVIVTGVAFKGDYMRIHKLPAVYALANDDLSCIKIGYSANLKQRMRNIQSGCPYDLFLWLCIRTDNPRPIEAYLHNYLKESRLRGEWFRPTEKQLDFLAGFFTKENEKVKEKYRALL